MQTVLEPAATATAPTPSRRGLLHRLTSRELAHYPATKPRMLNLGIVVLITIVLYYQAYVAGAVSTNIIREFHMSFTWYVNMIVVSYALGALASLCAGLADKYGRANLVVGGMLITSLLSMVGIPNAHSKYAFGALFVIIGFVEGVILVATPALIRDFSPQMGRSTAMAAWTLGPVIGSFVVSLVVSNTSDSTPWQDQYIACGATGLVVFAIALFGLRELAPRLRDQLMVSARDRMLVEARAKGINVEASLRKPFKQLFKLDVVGSAFAISVFLIIYFLAVGFFPVFFQTVFGFSRSDANAISNWFWGAQAIALLLAGYLSDRTRVRKPFMLFGAIGTIVATLLFALHTTDTSTSYTTFIVIVVLIAAFVGITYAPWMASFTETVEKRNPALTASGLAIWGLIIRTVVAISVFTLPHVVTTVTTLVADGPAVKAAVTGTDPKLNAAENAAVKAIAADPSIVAKTKSLAAKYQPELATAAKIDTATKAALIAEPTNPLTQVKALGEIAGLPATDVAKVIQLSKQDAAALATVQAIDQGTKKALLTNPGNTTAQVKAVTEIAAAFHITPAEAGARLAAVAAVPSADLAFMAKNAPAVQTAAKELSALGAMPKADKVYLATWGPKLTDPKVAASLTYLQKTAPGVQQAKADTAKQWQRYLFVAIGGQLVFIPLIFVMAGFWSPRRARKQAAQHEVWVNAELAKLAREQRTV